jgi:hypothetical protein
MSSSRMFRIRPFLIIAIASMPASDPAGNAFRTGEDGETVSNLRGMCSGAQ